ncbi:MAG: hypothetical protein JSR31_07280 [Nitrospira sp.]|nr:hypothetical protein [Nitrospira sp.]
MASESVDPIERWTAKRRVTLVVSILKGETSVAEAEDWREKFLLSGENALRNRPKDEEVVKDAQIKKLKQKIGELVLDNDILRETLKPYPLDIDGCGRCCRFRKALWRIAKRSIVS